MSFLTLRGVARSLKRLPGLLLLPKSILLLLFLPLPPQRREKREGKAVCGQCKDVFMKSAFLLPPSPLLSLPPFPSISLPLQKIQRGKETKKRPYSFQLAMMGEGGP